MLKMWNQFLKRVRIRVGVGDGSPQIDGAQMSQEDFLLPRISTAYMIPGAKGRKGPPPSPVYLVGCPYSILGMTFASGKGNW